MPAHPYLLLRVQWNAYAALGQDPVVYGSLKDQMDWSAYLYQA